MPCTHQGWQVRWFFLRHDDHHPFPAYTGREVGEAEERRPRGAVKNNKPSVMEAVNAIGHLKERGLNGAAIIGSYHQRRFAPLMARSLPMYAVLSHLRVVCDTVMAAEPLSAEDIYRLRKALASGPFWGLR